MSVSPVEDLFQDSVSSSSDLRTQKVFTFIGTILTILVTIFLNTVYKLLIIAGVKLSAKLALLTAVKHIKLDIKIPDIFPDVFLPNLSSKTPFINIEDASIHYSSPGQEYTGKFKYSGLTRYREEPIYVESYGRKRRPDGHSAWEDLEDWFLLGIL